MKKKKEEEKTEEKQEEAKPKLTIHSIDEFQKLQAESPELAEKLLLEARTTARQLHGTPKEDSGRRDINNHIIPVYTPKRPDDVVAVDELTRLERLTWACQARQRCVEIHRKQGGPLTEKQLNKVIGEFAKKSYLLPNCSKRLAQRVYISISGYTKLLNEGE